MNRRTNYPRLARKNRNRRIDGGPAQAAWILHVEAAISDGLHKSLDDATSP